jgi:cell division protein ZapA (FtsZ GTPase activity inhibitor)
VIRWHEQEISHIQHHSQASAKQLASKVAFSHIRDLGDEGFSKVCTCKDDLKERLGELTEWKKGIMAALTANKDILDDREGVRTVDEYLAEDMGKKDEMLKDARELALEKVMEESYGYNPQAPQEEEGEGEEAQPNSEEAQPNSAETTAAPEKTAEVIETTDKLDTMLIDLTEPSEPAGAPKPPVAVGAKTSVQNLGRNAGPMDWEMSIGMLESKQSTFGQDMMEQDVDDEDDDDDLLIVY